MDAGLFMLAVLLLFLSFSFIMNAQFGLDVWFAVLFSEIMCCKSLNISSTSPVLVIVIEVIQVKISQ